MTARMALQVLTPDKFVLDTSINAMRVLLPDGWWGIMPGHAPMISYIEAGIVHYTRDDSKRFIALYQGTIEVKPDPIARTKVLILTSAAEEGDDLEKVQSNLNEQAARLAKLAKEADLEFNQIRLSLEKALQEADLSDIDA
ncbi:MAG: F0F1 ATP synthase subunit epsilon [Brevefilum sp.]|nr:F0F1 ATP synthase subunit epsilon [Brevefilum sp.]MDT8381464.1 F0F1 ATP synthase subunit epsilon [Brevefilum sp.]MDW7753670.1 F0F1 ATP synthase subunit epsilon [Brevefilum sp.]